MMAQQLHGVVTRRVPCQNLIISAGSWSPEVFRRLFPLVDIGLRLAEKQHIQTWLRFSAPAVKDTDTKDSETTNAESEVCHQVWLNPLDEGDNVHVSSFKNGELYAAGALEEVRVEIPPLPQDVHPTPEDVVKLRDLVGHYVHLEGRQQVDFGRPSCLPCHRDDLSWIEYHRSVWYHVRGVRESRAHSWASF